MAKIINRFAQQRATEGRVRRDLRHREISLAQGCARRVHADENLGHHLDVEVFREFDDTYTVVNDLAKAFQRAEQLIVVDARIGACVRLGSATSAIQAGSF
jgi:hypothetical protein